MKKTLRQMKESRALLVHKSEAKEQDAKSSRHLEIMFVTSSRTSLALTLISLLNCFLDFTRTFDLDLLLIMLMSFLKGSPETWLNDTWESAMKSDIAWSHSFWVSGLGAGRLTDRLPFFVVNLGCLASDRGEYKGILLLFLASFSSLNHLDCNHNCFL